MLLLLQCIFQYFKATLVNILVFYFIYLSACSYLSTFRAAETVNFSCEMNKFGVKRIMKRP